MIEPAPGFVLCQRSPADSRAHEETRPSGLVVSTTADDEFPQPDRGIVRALGRQMDTHFRDNVEVGSVVLYVPDRHVYAVIDGGEKLLLISWSWIVGYET